MHRRASADHRGLVWKSLIERAERRIERWSTGSNHSALRRGNLTLAMAASRHLLGNRCNGRSTDCHAEQSRPGQSSEMKCHEDRAWDCPAVRSRCFHQAWKRHASNPPGRLPSVAATFAARRSLPGACGLRWRAAWLFRGPTSVRSLSQDGAAGSSVAPLWHTHDRDLSQCHLESKILAIKKRNAEGGIYHNRLGFLSGDFGVSVPASTAHPIRVEGMSGEDQQRLSNP